MSLFRSLSVAFVVMFVVAGSLTAADAPSFSKDVMPLMKQYCVRCHNDNRARANVNVESYVAMKTSKKNLVVPEKPDKSSLLLCLEGKGGVKAMPPAKSKVKLKSNEVAVIRSWIAAGARDDTALAVETSGSKPDTRKEEGEKRPGEKVTDTKPPGKDADKPE